MVDVTVTREDGPEGGRYVASVPGEAETGELVYARLAPDLIVAVHTGVPDSLGGKGVGSALVQRLVADAREGGYRVIPRCSFVAGQARRHPEWADVFVDA